MADDLRDLWRDDRLIEAAARGELLDNDDPASGPLRALAVVADGAPLPRLDVDSAALVEARHHHQRYAVRSLAVAVTVVATLSTSGVAAVVTGDPFRPAKAVWREIQDHTVARVDDADEEHVHSDAALAAPAEQAPIVTAQKSQAEPVERRAAAQGQTARAPVVTDPGTDGRAEERDRGPVAGADGGAEAEPRAYAEEEPEGSEQREPAEETGEQQDDQDQQSQPPEEEQQPAPDDQPDDDSLDPLVLPDGPGETVEGDSAQATPTQDPWPEDDGTDQEQVLSEPSGDLLADSSTGTEGEALTPPPTLPR